MFYITNMILGSANLRVDRGAEIEALTKTSSSDERMILLIIASLSVKVDIYKEDSNKPIGISISQEEFNHFYGLNPFPAKLLISEPDLKTLKLDEDELITVDHRGA